MPSPDAKATPADEAGPRPEPRCEFCGAFSDLELGGKTICEGCLAARGACCNEWDRDDEADAKADE